MSSILEVVVAHSVWAAQVQILGQTWAFSDQNCCQHIITECWAMSNNV